MSADSYLLKNGFNTDGSKMSKSQLKKRMIDKAKGKKRVVCKVDVLIAAPEKAKWLHRERQVQLDSQRNP